MTSMTNPDALVEEMLLAYYTAHPTYAVSPALAELCGVDLGAPIPYDVFLAKGGSLFGIERAFRTILPIIEAELASAKEQAERLAEALVELKGQVEQARDGFDRWPYNNSPSMKHSLTGAAKALAAWEKSRG